MSTYSNSGRGVQVDDGSRRAFLAAFGMTAVGAAFVASDAPTELRRSEQTDPLVLKKGDLIVPAGEVYVGWHINPTSAPLLTYVVGSVDTVETSQAFVSGFVGRRGRDAPQYIETAAVPIGQHDVSRPVTRAVDEWISKTYGSAVNPLDRSERPFEWGVTRDGWTEAVQLYPIGEWLLLTCAGGNTRAQLSPHAAVDHYGRLLAERATDRSISAA